MDKQKIKEYGFDSDEIDMDKEDTNYDDEDTKNNLS